MFSKLKTSLWVILVLCLLPFCTKQGASYAVRGRVVDKFGNAMSEAAVVINQRDTLYTNLEGYFNATNLQGNTRLQASDPNYDFSPSQMEVTKHRLDIQFKGVLRLSQKEKEILNGFENLQLSNGLVPSVEGGTVISLYDNALAALVFMMNDDIARAERIFDHFNNRISQELTLGVGGFSQFRSRSGVPTNHRWMGDNAWLLLALHNFKARTGSHKYDELSVKLEQWLASLQDKDGGLFAGYNAQNQLLDYKVTEGIIDAFAAIPGYTSVHTGILDYLRKNRWSQMDQSLISWPENNRYRYALDVHPWSFLIFPDFPKATLSFAQRFVTTQANNSQKYVTGFCFDDDRDAVWLEGTAQMCLAMGRAGMIRDKEFYLNEIRSSFQESAQYENAGGFPYATNRGTSYGSDLLWEGADTKPCVSSGAWYLFARWNFNPFEIGRSKSIPPTDIFW